MYSVFVFVRAIHVGVMLFSLLSQLLYMVMTAAFVTLQSIFIRPWDSLLLRGFPLFYLGFHAKENKFHRDKTRRKLSYGCYIHEWFSVQTDQWLLTSIETVKE